MSSWWKFERLRRSGTDGRLQAAAGDNATVDFYFLNALGDLVGDGECSDKPVRRLGPHTFAARDRLIVIRYVSAAEIAIIRARRWDRTYYVIDDALHDADRSVDLPLAYRRRLRTFLRDGLPAILELNPHVIAPSAHIFAAYPGLTTRLIDPCLRHPRDPDTDLDHHDAHQTLRLCFLGTRSHGASLDLLRSIAHALPAIAPEARLTMFFGDGLPRSMRRLASIDNRPPLSWPAFKRFVAQQRFHVCLAPLMPTPFNRGRSITKVLDGASVGAATLFSKRAPFDSVVSDGNDGFLLDDAPESWIAKIATLAQDRDRCRAIALGGMQLANAKGDRERLRRFWLSELDLTSATSP